MASNEGSRGPGQDAEDHGRSSFPQYPRTAGGPPSIVSSRMTDIASDEGEGSDNGPGGQQTHIRSGHPSEAGASRPGTARTGISSTRGHTYTWSQSQQLRRGLSGARRGSGTASSNGPGPRPPSSSHVPSLTSHAFFHPMSSQKLQAQRGGPRLPPGSTPRHQSPFQGATVENSPGSAKEDTTSTPTKHIPLPVPVPVPVPNPDPYPPRHGPLDYEPRPMSHGTEYTSNTSPTRGHHPQNSLSESVRPLQSRNRGLESRGLSVNTDHAKGYKSSLVGNMNLPTPRSFRSSFLLPNKNNNNNNNNNNQSNNQNRGTPKSKLDSTASTPQHSPKKSKSSKPRSHHKQQTPKLGKNYQYFEGNTIFCLSGRLQNTRQQRPVNLLTAAILLTPAILYFIFSAPYLWSQISPSIPILFVYIYYISLSSFIHASSMDPGVLPRRLHKFPPPSEDEDPLVLGPPSTDWVLVRAPPSKSHTSPGEGAMEVPVKYCKTCNIWRPPRAHHCRLCDSCIETVDHHCVWINNCVGRRNYRQFFTFIITATLGCIFILSSCLAQLLVYMTRNNTTFVESIRHFPVPFALIFYSVLGMGYPLPLSLYHLFLIKRGETTREFLSGRKLPLSERYRPFTLGGFGRNCLAVLCRPRGVSYYRFKGGYIKGDQRLSETKRGGRFGFSIGFGKSNGEFEKGGSGRRKGNGDREEVDVELREFGSPGGQRRGEGDRPGVPVRDGVGMVVTDLTKSDGKKGKKGSGLFGSWGKGSSGSGVKGPVLPT